MGVQVDPNTDQITVDGKRIGLVLNKKYYALHKPSNVVTTLSDPEGRTHIGHFLGKIRLRLFPIGRLDWNTEGLLILTNDGDYAHRVLHPSNNIVKTYIAKVDGKPSNEHLQKLVNGVTIIGGRVRAVSAKRMEGGGKKSDKYSWVQIQIVEGKNQQVRKMFEKIGYSVMRLKRTAIGHLKLGALKVGELRELTPDEAKKATF
jgi:23S rRNA pseudouridine2605 synthase